MKIGGILLCCVADALGSALDAHYSPVAIVHVCSWTYSYYFLVYMCTRAHSDHAWIFVMCRRRHSGMFIVRMESWRNAHRLCKCTDSVIRAIRCLFDMLNTLPGSSQQLSQPPIMCLLIGLLSYWRTCPAGGCSVCLLEDHFDWERFVIWRQSRDCSDWIGNTFDAHDGWWSNRGVINWVIRCPYELRYRSPNPLHIWVYVPMPIIDNVEGGYFWSSIILDSNIIT